MGIVLRADCTSVSLYPFYVGALVYPSSAGVIASAS